MYAGDLARIIKEVINNDITDSFNVAPSENLSIDEMANISLNILNKNLKKEVYLTDGSKYFNTALRSMFNNVNFNVKIIDIR